MYWKLASFSFARHKLTGARPWRRTQYASGIRNCELQVAYIKPNFNYLAFPSEKLLPPETLIRLCVFDEIRQIG